ncbi:hypothetical protein K2173_025206 [Erythroxylum novogranatense]|uniref:F-box domain-containing protein n=1 Tax=Erythroxylum novogranatense TaxID=1862640 RepID=A0AAV8UEG6_9ROSI|nr:hypothetical protein K2173_025206 [Erythroxylum novogranatense]
MEIGAGRNGELEHNKTQLISGLPDEIAFLCLARVPREFHSLLKCVSRRWRDLVCSEEFCVYRRKHNLSETWIYALCQDKFARLCCYVLDPNSSRRCWRPIQELPPRCWRRNGMGFETLGNYIYLSGGCGWLEDATSEAYCYDVLRNMWRESPQMPTARCCFSFEAFDGKLYAIGGSGSNMSDSNSWDTFDVRTNSWESHSCGNIVPEVADSVVLDGKIYIKCDAFAPLTPLRVVLYEPSSDTWQHEDVDFFSGWQGPAVAVDGTLYVLDESSGTRLITWQKDNREWVVVGRLSTLVTRPPCQLVAIGKKIFIVGKGLSTVAFDIDKTRNMGRVIISSSVARMDSDDDIVCCKCIAIAI